ncbi:MAG: tRNA-(ms[2]io[6]A)-hydroxylase [Planctomycetes bacterium]|nr:tRNA-(ms[2]io[6]A)-hydroxylase [Planctomycetota bacterium]
MLRLEWQTPRAWAARAAEHLDELLREQAHLEKKAAAAALNLLFRHPDRVVLQVPLARLAREELEHFERAQELLERRGVAFGRQVPGPYAERLLQGVRAAEPERLLDTLLACACIEARSCERMRLLAVELRGRDAELAEFYADLVASEARHHALYVRLAELCFPPAQVAARLAEFLAREATIAAAGSEEPRLHGGAV